MSAVRCDWISVNDRLPELLEQVLFTYVSFGSAREYDVGCRAAHAELWLGKHKVLPQLVTHWMPLPGAPE